MITVNDVIRCIEDFAPSTYQESYDNSGLQCGNPQLEVKKILLSIDITENTIEEAIQIGANLIVSHHPVIFSGIKRLTGKNFTERILIRAIKHDIAIYSCHTNIDNMGKGVSHRMAEKIGLHNIKVLKPNPDNLLKLVTFVPESHISIVQDAIFEAGAGFIGNYDSCSFQITGKGTFRANEYANPFVGEKGKLHTETETRIETIFPKHLENNVISALLKNHPYEEVAYDIYTVNNTNPNIGSGVYGFLNEECDEIEFLHKLKTIFNAPVIRHTSIRNKKIKKVALCGGAGSFLLTEAKKAGADIFISGDFKYHQFFEAEQEILIADIGHFESEQFTLEIFYELLIKKLPNFAICFTKIKTNPINYI